MAEIQSLLGKTALLVFQRTAAWDWDWANHATSEASLLFFPSATLRLSGESRADHAEMYMGAAQQRKERKGKGQ